MFDGRGISTCAITRPRLLPALFHHWILSAGACDSAERCDGTSVTCPPNQLVPTGFVCRAVAGATAPVLITASCTAVVPVTSPRVTVKVSLVSFVPGGLEIVMGTLMAVTPSAVYAGTLEHGLLIWNRTSQTWRAHKAGLPSANVTAILYHGNRLYVGTDNGLVMAEESRIGQ